MYLGLGPGEGTSRLVVGRDARTDVSASSCTLVKLAPCSDWPARIENQHST